MAITTEEKRREVQTVCEHSDCDYCAIFDECHKVAPFSIPSEMDDTAIRTLWNALHATLTAPRITIRDLIDLLDYDRTGIRTVRIVDEDTKNTDTLQTDSHLLEYIEDTEVNCIDTVGGVMTMYVNYGKSAE